MAQNSRNLVAGVWCSHHASKHGLVDQRSCFFRLIFYLDQPHALHPFHLSWFSDVFPIVPLLFVYIYFLHVVHTISFLNDRRQAHASLMEPAQ